MFRRVWCEGTTLFSRGLKSFFREDGFWFWVHLSASMHSYFSPISAKMRINWFSGILGMTCKMLYHPLLAAIITSNIFLRVSIKRVLLEYKISPFSNTRRKRLTLAAISGKVTRRRFISHSSSVQGRSNLFFLPFLLTVSTQSSKELGQLNYFSHLTALSSWTVQFSRLKGLWLHIVLAPIPSLLVMDGHHGEEVRVHHTYRFTWAKLLQ